MERAFDVIDLNFKDEDIFSSTMSKDGRIRIVVRSPVRADDFPKDQRGNDFGQREQAILSRIKNHYSQKLNRELLENEAEEIAYNLLQFAKAVYGE